jgi:predicted amino acid racemase
VYLDLLRRRNPDLALAAVRLHQAGALLANTYLLDLDAFESNTRAIVAAADAAGMHLYAMTKQFGRNPDGAGAVVAGGIPAGVAVDVACMEALLRGPLHVGHVGHLVQPHTGAERAVLAADPEVVTVFSHDVAERLSGAARTMGREQGVLLRVVGPDDHFYFGHGGGFSIEGIEAAARSIESLPGLRVDGVTTFPAILANPMARAIEDTPNFRTLHRAAERLRRAGFDVRQVNAPGTTSASTMAMLAAGGATHAEPGNGLHGTTPQHTWDEAAPEVPAIAYVSEVSHLDGDTAYAFGAGLYVDRVLGPYGMRAFVGRDEEIVEQAWPAEMAPDGAIHYYAKVHLRPGHGVSVGDTVLFCFRPQVFVTRGRTQGVAGIRSGQPELRGRYDGEARIVDGLS